MVSSHTPNELAAMYPHTTEVQRRVATTNHRWINNTGGNEPLDLLNRLHDPKSNLAFTNTVVFVMAVSVDAQVTLLANLEAHGVQL